MPKEIERKLKRKAKKEDSAENEPPPTSMERSAKPAGSRKRKRRNFVAKHAPKYNRSETYGVRTKYHRPDHRKIETGAAD